MDILNALLIKWKITDNTNYFYRTSGRSLTVKLLDLNEMNRAFLTLETVWLSIRIYDLLKTVVFEETVFQYAVVL
jgi:hypothetical protein